MSVPALLFPVNGSVAAFRYSITLLLATRVSRIASSISYTPFTLLTVVTIAECNKGAVVPPTATAYSPVQAIARRYVRSVGPRQGPPVGTELFELGRA